MTAHSEALRALHTGPDLLLLPNVWDATSARMVEAAGFPAVATGSGAVSASLGYDDGEQTPFAEMLAAVGRIARAVSVPVTADMESGYGMDPAELAAALLDAGVAGLNYEDTDHAHSPHAVLLEPESQAERIAVLRQSGLVVNARVDTFRLVDLTPDDRLVETIRRGRIYREAGADCVYPIVMADSDHLRAVVAEVGGAVNAFARPELPSLNELRAIGIRRVSFGSGLARVADAAVRSAVDALYAGADHTVITRPTLDPDGE
ncbi:MAG TPA: isocitrate lyase/phosphoenolpyruvate mutase family protein [Acidimicrobiales bacterium]|nr:isocitrate lyase/phosphoenolpyruvate mutase family protein [Acidimicrobiales bacterium]